LGQLTSSEIKEQVKEGERDNSGTANGGADTSAPVTLLIHTTDVILLMVLNDICTTISNRKLLSN